MTEIEDNSDFFEEIADGEDLPEAEGDIIKSEYFRDKPQQAKIMAVGRNRYLEDRNGDGKVKYALRVKLTTGRKGQIHCNNSNYNYLRETFGAKPENWRGEKILIAGEDTSYGVQLKITKVEELELD